MSGIVDMRTSELSKLQSKGQTTSSGGSAQQINEAARHETETSGSFQWLTGLARALEVKKNKLTSLQCSEASLSMLVESFSA